MTIRVREYWPTIHPSIVLRRMATTRPPKVVRPRRDLTVLVDGGAQTAAIKASEAVMAAHTAKNAVAPHDWASRRTGVIAQFRDTVMAQVTPIGFTDPWKPFPQAVSRLEEIEWIDQTCEQELPPEWLSLRANGLRGESLDALIATEDDSYTLADLVPDSGYIPMFEMVHGAELLGGMRRIEAFLKEQDEQNWYTYRPRRYFAAVDGQARVGFVPTFNGYKPHLQAKDIAAMSRHLPSTDDVIWASKHRTEMRAENPDPKTRWRWLWRQDTFAKRDTDAAKDARALYYLHDTWEAERDAEPDMDFVEEDANVYSPNTPCPNEMCAERGDDCVVCQGSKYVTHTLGMDAQADWPPPGWLREPKTRYESR